MPPKLLVDVSEIDMDAVVVDRDAIRKVIPQRFEMEQVEVVHLFDRERRLAAGSLAVREDDWWARGHIPGRPIFPGALIMEAAAQLSTWLFKELTQDERFFGFGAVDEMKFRGAVVPPCRLVLVARLERTRSRIAVFETQGLVDGSLVFTAKITGMAV